VLFFIEITTEDGMKTRRRIKIIYFLNKKTYHTSVNTSKDNRRYPRIDHVTSQQIIRLDEAQTPHKNYIITKNMSACGIRFTTHEELTSCAHFMIYLNDHLVKSITANTKNWFRLGCYYLARVAWTRELKTGLYEVGASFLERESCNHEQLETFTELVNLDMLDMLPAVTHV